MKSGVWLTAILWASLLNGCGGDDGFGAYLATIRIDGDCERSDTRGADVEVFGNNVVLFFYNPPRL